MNHLRVHNDLPGEWMVPGAPCWYYPHSASDRSYAGVIDGKPYRIGDQDTGTWCVRLRDMERAYHNGRRTTVAAAACWSVQPR